MNLQRVLRYARRGLFRTLLAPAVRLPEGAAKHRVRTYLLRRQNSLTTELAVNPGDTVVQVGTPSPRTLRRFRRRTGANGRVVIFEAEPSNAERLRETVRADGYRNVWIVNAAAYSETRSGEIARSPYQGDHKIAIEDVRIDNDVRSGNDTVQMMPCEFVRLDDKLPELGIDAVDYLSVTVNGAELEVLRGASGLFDGSRGLRIYSKGHAYMADGQPLNVHITRYLRDQGFQAMVTRGEPSPFPEVEEPYRAGDVYAWRQP